MYGAGFNAQVQHPYVSAHPELHAAQKSLPAAALSGQTTGRKDGI
nr:hypothetical protein [Enterobacter cloacae complex sp.]